MGRAVTRIIGRLVLSLAVLAITGFVLLVLIGLWDRYEKETAALGFRAIYERLAWLSGSSDWKTRTSADGERAPRPAIDRERVAAWLVLKLVGTRRDRGCESRYVCCSIGRRQNRDRGWPWS